MSVRLPLFLVLALLVPAATGCGSDSASPENGTTTASPTTISMFDASTQETVELKERALLEEEFVPALEKKGHRIDDYTVDCQPDTERTFTCTSQFDATAENGECGTFLLEAKGVIDDDGTIDFTSQRAHDEQQRSDCS